MIIMLGSLFILWITGEDAATVLGISPSNPWIPILLFGEFTIEILLERRNKLKKPIGESLKDISGRILLGEYVILIITVILSSFLTSRWLHTFYLWFPLIMVISYLIILIVTALEDCGIIMQDD